VKTPSGRNDVRDTYFLPQGTTDFTVDQSIQLGDGGWGLVLQGLAFARLRERVNGHASGSYLVTPRNQSAVLQSPTGSLASVHVSIPDVFNANMGLSFDVSPRHGVTAGLSGRVDGIPTRLQLALQATGLGPWGWDLTTNTVEFWLAGRQHQMTRLVTLPVDCGEADPCAETPIAPNEMAAIQTDGRFIGSSIQRRANETTGALQ
jgi:hypothetical protein